MSTLLQACQSEHQDILDFISTVKAESSVKELNLPLYADYKPYTYDGGNFRSPFEPPIVIDKKILMAKSNVKPDLTRQKHRLESYNFSSLSMVGTIGQKGVLWALIRDPEGVVERVKKGDYMGEYHGRITHISHHGVDVVEILSNGLNGWIERPNIMPLKGFGN
jgi:type IV pilus assembly protein PilP